MEDISVMCEKSKNQPCSKALQNHSKQIGRNFTKINKQPNSAASRKQQYVSEFDEIGVSAHGNDETTSPLENCRLAVKQLPHFSKQLPKSIDFHIRCECGFDLKIEFVCEFISKLTNVEQVRLESTGHIRGIHKLIGVVPLKSLNISNVNKRQLSPRNRKKTKCSKFTIQLKSDIHNRFCVVKKTRCHFIQWLIDVSGRNCKCTKILTKCSEPSFMNGVLPSLKISKFGDHCDPLKSNISEFLESIIIINKSVNFKFSLKLSFN